jgi:hypothetical protein
MIECSLTQECEGERLPRVRAVGEIFVGYALTCLRVVHWWLKISLQSCGGCALTKWVGLYPACLALYGGIVRQGHSVSRHLLSQAPVFMLQ